MYCTQIIIAGEADAGDTKALLDVINSFYLPNKILIVHRPGSKSFLCDHIPVLGTVVLKDGKATAYVCENYTCTAPVNGPKELKKILKPRIAY